MLERGYLPESRLETEDRWQERLVTKDRLCKGYYARFTETEPPLADPHERWCERTGARRPLLLDFCWTAVGVAEAGLLVTANGGGHSISR